MNLKASGSCYKVSMYDVPLQISPRGIYTRQLINEDSCEVVNLVLKEDDSISPHIKPVDVLFYVIKGTGYIEVGNERYQVQEGDVVYGPKYIPHAVYVMQGEMEVLMVKITAKTGSDI